MGAGRGRKSGLRGRIKRRMRSRPGFHRSSPIVVVVVVVVVASRSTGRKKKRKFLENDLERFYRRDSIMNNIN